MKLSLKPTAGLVRATLASHSVLGLTAAALMYVLCVSGTLAVFYKELERWEQPTVVEVQSVSPQALNRAAAATMARVEEAPEHLFFTLPTAELPRLIVGADEVSWFASADGELMQPVAHDWTHFLIYLHIALNLPTTLGLTIVGMLGAMLVALIVSGLLAHPNIFRDAFSLRMGGSERLGQVDLHNRMSVWGTPFHLAIALTGAFIGLSSVLVYVAATLFYQGDTDAAGASVFGAEPEPTDVAAPLADVGAAVRRTTADHPGELPFYVTIHEPATTAQVVDVGAHVPRRVVWAERYRYDAAGTPMDTLGWADGSFGQQLYASTFRIHFGHFGGLPVMLAYVLLGASLCVVTATGVNIWVAKRRQRGVPADAVERMWAAVVWGVPAAIALSALTNLAAALPAAPVFWLTTLALVAAAWRLGDARAWSRGLRIATAILAAAVVLAHVVRFGGAALTPASLIVNLVWLVLAAGMTLSVTGLPVDALRRLQPQQPIESRRT